MSGIVIRRPKSAKDFEGYYRARWRYLRRPWHRPLGSERDGLERRAVHIIAVEDGRVVGVARMHFTGPGAVQLRYMGVERRLRKRGIARRLLRALEREARKRGVRVAWCNVREPAVPFYERCGYAIFGKSYTLYGCIPHWKMMREL